MLVLLPQVQNIPIGLLGVIGLIINLEQVWLQYVSFIYVFRLYVL